jgi:hypothetical protein
MTDVGALRSDRLTLGGLLLRIDALRLKVCDFIQARLDAKFVISHGYSPPSLSADIYLRMESETTDLRPSALCADRHNQISSKDYVERFHVRSNATYVKDETQGKPLLSAIRALPLCGR